MAETESPTDRSGFVGPSILRNVSSASLTPFLPDERSATGAAVIIAPGGGGVELSMETQGYQVARWLNERGIAAFVLKYRLVPTPKETSKFLELITKESGKALEGVVSAQDAADAATAATQDGLDAVMGPWQIGTRRFPHLLLRPSLQHPRTINRCLRCRLS